MDSVKALADMTIKISEARNTLTRLEATKMDYVKLREKKAQEQIQKIFDDSVGLTDKIRNNNEEIHTLYRTVSSYKAFLDEGLEAFKGLLEEFEERNKAWAATTERQVKDFGEIEQQIKRDRKAISDSKKEIEESQEEIRRAKIKIADDREMIKRSMERLTNNQK